MKPAVLVVATRACGRGASLQRALAILKEQPLWIKILVLLALALGPAVVGFFLFEQAQSRAELLREAEAMGLQLAQVLSAQVEHAMTGPSHGGIPFLVERTATLAHVEGIEVVKRGKIVGYGAGPAAGVRGERPRLLSCGDCHGEQTRGAPRSLVRQEPHSLTAMVALTRSPGCLKTTGCHPGRGTFLGAVAVRVSTEQVHARLRQHTALMAAGAGAGFVLLLAVLYGLVSLLVTRRLSDLAARVTAWTERVAGRGEVPSHPDEIEALDRLYTDMMARVEEAHAAALRAETERAHAEERAALQAQLHQHQKLEAIGLLAGGVAHDFNNLLMAISGYTSLILESLGKDDPLRPDALEIQKAAERAATLTRQLLAFSRRQVLKPRVLDLNELLAGIEKMLRRLLGEDIELQTHLEPLLGRVLVDPGQMEQVIVNMAVNAREAMPLGGRLTLETANALLDEAYTRRQGDLQPGSYVRLAIIDTGCGMDEQTRSHIFEPFFTTKKDGTGLGLATCYGIIKQSGGHIEVESDLGRGTAFRIYLPRVDEEAQSLVAKGAQAVDLLQGTERVLVVEDEESVRSLVSRALRQRGYTVLEAGSVDEALAHCQRHQEPIDLLVTDVVMPQMGGRELAERVAFIRPGLRVLYMSGYPEEALTRHGLQTETPLLQKPFTLEELARKVREVLDATD